jgi:bleomycin hydrolase
MTDTNQEKYPMKAPRIIILACICLFRSGGIENELYSQTTGYDFKDSIRLESTEVKNQGRTGTCWSFGTISFLESELIRKGKGLFDLSEMFIVRQSYIERAELYIRFHGNIKFGAGAEPWDAVNVLIEDGIVPEEVFPGKLQEEGKHDHRELDAVLKGYVEGVNGLKNETLSPVWMQGYVGILDVFLGEFPSAFTYGNDQFAPKSFLSYLNIDPTDYIYITSFDHHPYYSKYVFESPDNWSMGYIHNVPLDDIIDIIDYSLGQGYTVAWAADISDPGFSFKSGIAVVPEQHRGEVPSEEKSDIFEDPVKERKITPELRQEAFDNRSTTDDHMMHITGVAKDRNGTIYYIPKNSWGTENPYGGYMYVSKAYVRLKTMSLMVNKYSIPEEIRDKLNL